MQIDAMQLQRQHDCSSIYSVPDAGAEGCVATLGFFDGVHRGHRFLLGRLTELAREKSLPSLVLTFWPHPHAVLGKVCPPLLTDCCEKVELINQCGVGHTEILPFTLELSQLPARDFMEKILRDTYNVKYLIMGYDHRFGRRGDTAETFEDYRRYGESLGVKVIHAGALSDEHKAIGSSSIREALLRHDIEAANEMLGYPYTITGHVERGFENGHKLGYPTANVMPRVPEKLVPANGVYAVEVIVEDVPAAKDTAEIRDDSRGGKAGPYRGMMNIGCRPTLHNGAERSIEVNIFDFSENIYGRSIRIEIRHFVREERAFLSTEALSEQLSNDRRIVRSFFDTAACK